MRIPTIAKNSSLYTIAQFLQKGIGFLLIPLYTRFLTPEDYGIMNLLTSIMGFLSFFIMLSLHAAAQRFHYDASDSKARSQLWGTLLIMVLTNSLILGGATILFHKYIIDPFTEGINFWELTIWSLISVMLSPLYTYYQQWLQVTEKGISYTINLILNYIFTLFFNIIFVVFWNLGVFGMLLSTVIVSFIFFTYSFIKFIPHVSLSFNNEVAKKSIRYSLPLVPNSVIGYASVMGDRILLNKLSNNTSIGLYSIASNFGNILNTVTTSINQAFSPWFFKELANGKIDKKKLNDFITISIVVCSYLSFLITIFSPEIIYIMTPTPFHQSWQPIIFICFGFVFNGLYYFFSKPLFYYKPSKVMYVSILQLTINMGLNILLIPKIGYIGAGYAFLASEIVAATFSLILSKKISTKIHYNWKQFYLIVVILFMFSYFVFPLEYLSLPLKILIKIFVILLISIIIYLKTKNLIYSYIKNK